MTTAIDFGILAFALFPVLQQFVVAAVVIVYAVLASVLVLASMLVPWARYTGPEGWTAGDRSRPTSADTVDD